MQQIVDALMLVNTETQSRVLRWACERYEIWDEEEGK